MILSYRATVRAMQKMGFTSKQLNSALKKLIKATPSATQAMKNYGIAVRKIKKEVE